MHTGLRMKCANPLHYCHLPREKYLQKSVQKFYEGTKKCTLGDTEVVQCCSL